MNLFRKLYMRIFPASKRQITALGEKLDEIIDRQQKTEDRLDALEKSLENEIAGCQKKIKTEISFNQESVLGEVKSGCREIVSEIGSLRKERQICEKRYFSQQEEILGFARENNWGLVFNNTVMHSAWLSNQAFSFGRWAIGYQCAYVLFRILDEIKPDKILELGLGQSTKITGQYASSRDGIEHLIIESDQNWINFFENNYEVSSHSEIIHCDCSMSVYKDADGIRIFDEFDKKMKGKKFDLIIIDAPFGGDMKDFSRIDVLRSLPDCIGDSFVILLDDVERQGEQNTFDEMKQRLHACRISFSSVLYRGKKSVGVIASENLKFVLTM